MKMWSKFDNVTPVMFSEEKYVCTSWQVAKWLFNFFLKKIQKQPPEVFYKKAVLFSSKYSKIFKSTYFEENSRTVASETVHMKLKKKTKTKTKKTPNSKYLLQLIKTRSKVQETNVSWELALSFHQWKTFFENYKPITDWF